MNFSYLRYNIHPRSKPNKCQENKCLLINLVKVDSTVCKQMTQNCSNNFKYNYDEQIIKIGNITYLIMCDIQEYRYN